MQRLAWVLVAATLAGCASTTQPPATVAPACPDGATTFAFERRDIQEASGLFRSLRTPCLVWTHNDSGGKPELYASDARGRDLGVLRVGAPAIDWEDLSGFTLDGRAYLVVADIGNNFLQRETVQLYVVPEPALGNASFPAAASAHDVRPITVRYPEAPFDGEAFAVDAESDVLLFISKRNGPDQALYTASLSAALDQQAVTLAFRTTIPGIPLSTGEAAENDYVFGSSTGRVTAMDVRPDRRALAVLTYAGIYVWPRADGQDWAEALRGPPQTLSVPAPGRDQMEGLAYDASGAYLFVADEAGRPRSELSVVPALPRR